MRRRLSSPRPLRSGDKRKLIPMTDAIEVNLGKKPEQMSADNGYCSEVNLEALDVRGIDGYVATGRAKDAAVTDPSAGMPVVMDDDRSSDVISRPEAALPRRSRHRPERGSRPCRPV